MEQQPARGTLASSEVTAAFHEAYRRLGVQVTEVQEAATLLYALTEVMVDKGVVGLDELEHAKRPVRDRLDIRVQQAGMTVQLSADAPDKHAMADATAEIDCADRLHLCRAACCRLRFALSEQDVTDGTVQWTLSEPYLNRQEEDGYCAHNDPATRGCGIYADRPAVCRSYDCRDDPRIWLDFDGRVVNPDLAAATSERPQQPDTQDTVVPAAAKQLPVVVP